MGTISDYNIRTKVATIDLENKDSMTLHLTKSLRCNKCWVQGMYPKYSTNHQAQSMTVMAFSIDLRSLLIYIFVSSPPQLVFFQKRVCHSPLLETLLFSYVSSNCYIHRMCVLCCLVCYNVETILCFCTNSGDVPHLQYL